MKITLNRLDDAFHFEAKNEDGKTVIMDAAEKIGGRNKGVRPTQMLLMALAGCAGIDIISILKKQKQKISDFKSEVEGEQENVQNEGKVFTDVHATFRLKGELDNEKVLRAAALSIDKYCSVEKTLRLAGAKISYSVFVNDQKLK